MKFLYAFFFLLFSLIVQAQNFSGQWKGGFNETSYGYAGLGGSQIDYVLELQTKGSSVSGYSYTYFREGQKRYYTICKLTGEVNRAEKEITVTEIERVKYNTPPDFSNCFQTHILTYERDTGQTEVLKGKWMPAPNQKGNCGFGITLLSRRVIQKLPMGITDNRKNNTNNITKKYTAPPKKVESKTGKDLAKNNPKVTHPVDKQIEEIKDVPVSKPDIAKTTSPVTPVQGFKSRRKDIIKTIPIKGQTFKIDFYDNGEIDGDSISVFYNGKIVLSHMRLTDKPVSLNLPLDNLTGDNVVTMYAENLGSIPPNTALMIVTDGEKRYEVRITSDTEKSGSVVFVHDK